MDETKTALLHCVLSSSGVNYLGSGTYHHVTTMSETPTMDKVVLPTDDDFEEFRTHCSEDEGWNEVYKDSKYKVWTKKVCKDCLLLIIGLLSVWNAGS